MWSYFIISGYIHINSSDSTEKLVFWSDFEGWVDNFCDSTYYRKIEESENALSTAESSQPHSVTQIKINEFNVVIKNHKHDEIEGYTEEDDEDEEEEESYHFQSSDEDRECTSDLIWDYSDTCPDDDIY